MDRSSSIPLSAQELSTAVREGRAYDPGRLDRVLGIDERRGLIEVQARASWQAIAGALRPGDERAAALAAFLPNVGASVEHNGAGPDGRPAVLHVESLAVVLPNGEIRRADRTGNRELFALVVGGRGLLGALYSVTLGIGSLARALNEAATVQQLAPGQAERRSRPLRLLLPPEKVDDFLGEARERCGHWRMPLAGAKVRPTLEESDTYLRWARRPYSALALQLDEAPALGVAVRSTQLRRELIDAAIERGGSFALSCTPEATREHAEACYPQLRDFLAQKRRVDPQERLTNAWYWHHRNLFARPRCDVRWGG